MAKISAEWLTSMYYGEAQTVLDDKGRITVPRRFRIIMEVMHHDVWYLTRGFDRSIFLFHRDTWKSILAQAGRFSSMHAKALDFRRLLFSSVADVRTDRQGRMPVPIHLREYAGLERDVVLIGVDDHLELWDRNAWRAFQQSKEAEYKEMAAQLFVQEEGATAATQ